VKELVMNEMLEEALSPSSVPEMIQRPGLKITLLNALLDSFLLASFWFLFMIIGTFIWVLQQFIQYGKPPAGAPGPMALILISMPTLYLAIAALWLWRGRRIVIPVFEYAKQKLVVMALGLGCVLFVFNTLMAWLLQQSGTEITPSNQAIIEDTMQSWPIATALFAVVIGPVFEELFFRKQIFARLVAAGYAGYGFVISSLMFALLHELVPTQGVLKWVLMLSFYALMGAAFAWIYRKTGKLWPAILSHATNNLCAIVFMHISAAYS
jgi:uncharacterized protein